MSTNVRTANQAWESLLTAHTTLMRDFAAEPVWRNHGITMREYDVLYTLAKCQQPVRLGELQSSVLLSQPALSRLVERLTARGLIVRTNDSVDGRAVRLALSAEGRDLQRSVGRSHARSVARAMQALSDDEQELLRSLSAKLINSTPSKQQ